MIRRKKEIKQIFLAAFFIIIVFLTNVYILNNSHIIQNVGNKNIIEDNPLNEINLSSNLNLSDLITGNGSNQDVRIYVNNVSKNLKDNKEFFEIPSIDTEEMFLTYGNFSFKFQNNYTTDYVIEDDDALYANDFISFDFNSSNSDIKYHNGSLISGDLDELTDENLGNFIDLDSENGLINFTITANYSNTEDNIAGKGNVEFNRTKILALISALLFTVEINVNLTIRIKNYTNSNWQEILSLLPINNRSETSQEIKNHIINENLHFINKSNVCDIQFIFERWDQTEFYLYLHEYDLPSTFAFDLPITNTSYVALEFDLKGLESAVNGVDIWIRTLNLTEAVNTHFNLSLYRANATMVRTESNLRNINLDPDYSDLIDNKVVDSYRGDNYTYFAFNLDNTGKLNLSNYFIVIKSNSSKQVYSLVTLPWFDYGDDKTEHQLKTTVDDGLNWNNAKKNIETDVDSYTSGQLDVSLFILNVTRGYMPSDFNMSGMYNLTIQNLPIEDLEISSYPYNGSTYLKWGLGQWIHNFTTPISDENTNNFTIYLTWNKTHIKGFQFNVSYYFVNAYWTELASTNYSVSYNDDPEWIFNYDRNVSDTKFTNWSFYEFWFVYPDYFTAQNLTDPNNQEIYWRLSKQSNLTSNPSYDKVVVSSSFANINGIYSLNLTSHNFINQMYSYINYNGTLWETKGFMYGDNISIAVRIQDHKFNAPIHGNVNATLFYPNGTRFIEAQLNSSDGIIDGSTLFYDFANRTILNLTNTLKVFGEYHLGFFWFNGSAIGCKEIIVYIDTYEAELYNFEYYSEINKNILDGKIEKVYQNYTLLVASVNKRDPIPDYYPINDANVSTHLVYEIGDQQIPILIDTFKQSQNIINPDEVVNVKVSLTNLYEILPVNAKLNVKLVSYANEEWIIAENTTNYELLEFYGHPNDTKEFTLNLKIPELNTTTNIWPGKNNPIRLAGAKVLVTVFIDDNEIGMYDSGHISLLSEKTSDNYDGYILGLKINEEMRSESLVNEFDRDQCLYLPSTTSILLNMFDRNYISSYNQYSKDFSLRLNSKFINISYDPETPIKGEIVNISSLLVNEFGDPLTHKNVTCQYYYLDSWVLLDSNYTNSNGYIEFLINTQQINFKEDLLIRLSWDGDNVNGASKNISINTIHQSNNISISINKNVDRIYRNRKTTMNVIIRNSGDSNLRVIRNISIDINHTKSYSIVSIDYLKFEQLLPGESTTLVLEMDVGNIDNLDILISITIQNILTNESKTTSKETSFEVFSPSIYDYFTEYFVIIIIALFSLIWVIAVFYAWKVKKRIETPIEEPAKKRPRRKRYVPVSELKKPTPPKKPSKKKGAPKEVKKKKETDLDSLLEERGLTDKKKKS